ncbi:MAG: DUF47 family protein [Candidatus Lokiarchaeota archaeon]|nr:DUF47 family protein [Candidatus Lokiarchaeota archaeon]
MQKIKNQILTLMIEHSRIIYSVMSSMAVYYNLWQDDVDSHKIELEKKRSKMQILEEDADGIKIRVIKEYSEVQAQGLGDYMALILSMDNTINSALEFVDIISKIHPKEEINEEIKKRYHNLINNLLKMGDGLKLAIKDLRDSPQEVFKNTTIIHEVENIIDKIFREFLDYLYGNNDIEIRLLLRIRDSIKILEELADRIHDIADVIRVLLYQ